MKRFRKNDRIIYRNHRGALAHGIVQSVQGAALIVEESCPLTIPKTVNEGVFAPVAEDGSRVWCEDVIRKANLRG